MSYLTYDDAGGSPGFPHAISLGDLSPSLNPVVTFLIKLPARRSTNTSINTACGRVGVVLRFRPKVNGYVVLEFAYPINPYPSIAASRLDNGRSQAEKLIGTRLHGNNMCIGENLVVICDHAQGPGIPVYA